MGVARSSLPLEGRVAAKPPGGASSTSATPFRSFKDYFGALPNKPHPARCAGHPPLKGEGTTAEAP